MRKTTKQLFAFALVIIFLTNCKSELRKDQMQKLGIFGQHDLRRIEQTSGINGRMIGGLIFGLSGNLSSKQKLQFYWGRTPEEFIPTALPYSHFRFIVNESRTVPTVEFVFDENMLNSMRLVYTESEKQNLNYWLGDENIRSGFLRVAVVRISRKDLEKEVYLPRQQ